MSRVSPLFEKEQRIERGALSGAPAVNGQRLPLEAATILRRCRW